MSHLLRCSLIIIVLFIALYNIILYLLFPPSYLFTTHVNHIYKHLLHKYIYNTFTVMSYQLYCHLFYFSLLTFASCFSLSFQFTDLTSNCIYSSPYLYMHIYHQRVITEHNQRKLIQQDEREMQERCAIRDRHHHIIYYVI